MFIASPLFCCGSIYPVLYQCGNRNGNNLSQTGRRFDCSFGQRNQPAKVLAHFFGFVWSTFRVFALAKFVGSCVEGPQWRDTSGKMPLSSLTMESDATNGIPEGLAICQSPMCNVRFEQTGMKVNPRCYCSDECKWNAWAFRRVRSLLKALSDAEALKVLRDS